MAGQTTIQVLLLILMIGIVVKCTPRFNADQKPNIIFLLADDMVIYILSRISEILFIFNVIYVELWMRTI